MDSYDKSKRYAPKNDSRSYGKRQPRPQRRRTGTRTAIVALALKEA